MIAQPKAKLGRPNVRGSNDAHCALKTRARAEAGTRKRHSYKPLPAVFRRGGVVFRQIAREGDFAIYSQSWGGCNDPSVCFELIRIRRRDGFHIAGRFVEPAEVYPRADAWGTDGFTLPHKNAAFAKLRELV